MLDYDKDQLEWDELVARLAAFDIRYLGDGAAPHPTDVAPVPELVCRLIVDLCHVSDGRLRDVLPAFLVRHPELGSLAQDQAELLPAESSSRQWLEVSVIVAAALQREWAFSLDLYISPNRRIEADTLAERLGLPAPDEDYGRPCLKSAAALLRAGMDFPVDFEEGWEHATELLLRQLARPRLPVGT